MNKKKKVEIECVLIQWTWCSLQASKKGLKYLIICDEVITENFDLFKCEYKQKAKFTWVRSSKGALCYTKIISLTGNDYISRREEGGFGFADNYGAHPLYPYLREILLPLFDEDEKEIRCDLYMELID